MSASSLTVHTLSFHDDLDAPCALLVDKRAIPCFQTPTRPKFSTPTDRDGKPYFEIRPAGPGRGLGMFATRYIPTGAIIVVEHPAIITPINTFLPKTERSSTYRRLFAALPDKRRRDLRMMANSQDLEDCETLEEGIIRTNGTAIEIDFPDEAVDYMGEYGAVFLVIDRCNHSCAPNAAHKWDPRSFSSTLYALRSISASEEISIIYTDVTRSRDTRRAHLFSNYRFLCQCPSCSLPSHLVVESDVARAALRNWRYTRPTYTGWATDLCRPDDFVLNSHMEALSLIEREGLQGMESSFVKDVCLCWAVLGEEEQFKEWAKRLERLSNVRDPATAQEVRGWLEKPRERVPKWGWRKKQRNQMSKKLDPPSPESYCLPLLF